MSIFRTAAFVAFLWSTTAGAQSGGNIYLTHGKVFFQAMDFEKCVQRMEQAARWTGSTRTELAEIELFSGLCKFSLGEKAAAEDHFTLALQIDPALQLPPGVSPRIAESFDAVAARVRPTAATRAEGGQEQQGAAADAPRKLSREPTATQAGSLNEALTPPAESPTHLLPITLGGVSVAAAIAGGIFGNLAKTYEQQHNDRTTYYAEGEIAARNANNSALAANIGFGLAATAAVTAVTTLLLDL